MRIVNWNCNGAFRRKVHLLDKYEADVLVVQECENPKGIEISFGCWAENYLWIGDNKNRGLAVFSNLKTPLIALEWEDNGLELFLPCQIDDRVKMVAVWTKNPRGTKFPYIGQLWNYLQLNECKIKGNEFIICGDLNSNSKWDKRGRIWNHSNVVNNLLNMEMVSIYHSKRNEKQGQEKESTLYLQRNIKKPHYVDYAFLSSSIYNDNCKIQIGLFEEWIPHSDHMPVIFEF
jgi:exonuclease III